ncbi:MAG: hypothetical protein H0W16_03150 [Actinobacteria bacterium]|nr:hypothetical protein [Actinomycetota bacterium]
MGAAWGEESGHDVSASGPEDPRLARVEALEAQVRELDAQLRARSGTGETPAGSRALSDRLTDRVEVLAQRVDTLSDTARAASSGLVARERELAAIRREVADVQGRVDAAVADFHRRIDRGPVEALQRTVTGLVDDVKALRQSQEALVGRLDSLSSTAEAARAGITAHERALGELSTELETGSTKLDSVVVAVRQAIESLLAQVEAGNAHATGPGPGESPTLVDAVAARVDSLAADLESSTSAFAGRERALAESQLRLEMRLDALAERLVGGDARPRLVTWGQRVPETDDHPHEHERDGIPRAENLPRAGAPTGQASPGDSSLAGSDSRDPIVSFGGGT